MKSIHAAALTVSFALAAVLGACTESSMSVGAPCESNADCDHGMICDVHDGQGTCQDDHGHEAGSETFGEANCELEDRDDAFAVGLSKTGSFATATFVSADPAPPGMDLNTWVLSFTDAEGAPLDGLDIVAIPTMPDHGHGTPTQVVVTPTGTPGEYELSAINLFMAGYWEIALELDAGEDSDALMFAFCVE